MATDTPRAFLGYGTDHRQAIVAAHPDALLPEHASEFAAGSMRPKILAACDFAKATGRPALIGQLSEIDALVQGRAGTRIATDVDGLITEPDPS